MLSFAESYKLFVATPWLGGLLWLWVGLCIGSFLNVCIWRIPNGMSLISPPSHCPKCDHPIRAWENIPVISWLCLRGKCSGCKQPISIRYPLVESLTGLVFLAVYFVKAEASAPVLLLYSITAAVLIATAFTDCDYRIVPDSIVMTQLITVVLILVWKQYGHWQEIAVYLLANMVVPGILLCGFAMLGRGLTGKQVFGWGDVKLLTVLAPVTGIINFLWLLLTAAVLALVIAPFYKRIKPKMRHRPIPFVPFIALASALIMLTPLTVPLAERLYPALRVMGM